MCRFEESIRENGSKRVISHFDGPSLTRQEFKDECDIGKIIARFVKTPEGMLALQNVHGYLTDVAGRFHDVSGIPDHQTAFELVRRAEESFEAMPAALRTRFDNSPAIFMDFVMNPANQDELVKLGLARAVEKPVNADAAVPSAG